MIHHSDSRSRGSSAAFWKRQLQQHRASGLSVAAFCRSRDLAPASFYAWRRRLLDHSASRLAATVVGPESISWHEVSLSSLGSGVVASTTGQGEPLGIPGAANALRLGSIHGLWAEFSRFPSPEELTAVCRAIHPPLPPLC